MKSLIVVIIKFNVTSSFLLHFPRNYAGGAQKKLPHTLSTGERIIIGR